MTKRTADLPPDPLRGIASFKDALGVRMADPSAGESVERLVLCAELAPLETAIRDRVTRLSNFRHVRFPRVRAFDVRGTGGDRVAAITFDRTVGIRLSELQRPIDKGQLVVDVSAALQVAREALPALAVLHDSRAVAHGAIALERMVLTPHGRIVLVDHVLAAAIEKLQYPRTRLWKEFRIAVPPSAGLPRFDARSDVAQVALATFVLVLGRPLVLKEFPDGLKDLLSSTSERLGSGAVRPMTPALRAWFERALPIESRKPFTSALDAQVALEDVLKASHAYAPSASALRQVHDRYVAWEGAQRSADGAEVGHVEPAAGASRHPASPPARRASRRPALRVVHHDEDEADEIRHLEAELERIRREEALAEQQAVGAESVGVAPIEVDAAADGAACLVLPPAEASPSATAAADDGVRLDAPTGDVLTIDLDALADAVGASAAPEQPGPSAGASDAAEATWELRPPSVPTEVGAVDPEPEPAAEGDDRTAALPFEVEPEPETPPLGRLIAAAAQANPPALETKVVNRLAEELSRTQRDGGSRPGRHRRTGERRRRAAALPARATPIEARVALRGRRAVDEATAHAPALHLSSPAPLEQITKPPVPSLAPEATPVIAGLAAAAPAGALQHAVATAPPLNLAAGAASVEDPRRTPLAAIPARFGAAEASLAAPPAESLIDRAVREFTPLMLVPGEGLARVRPDVEQAADEIFIDAEAFELADGVAALPVVSRAAAPPVALAPDTPETVVEAASAVEPMPAVEAPIAAEPEVEAAVAVEPVVEELAAEESVPVVEAPVSAEPAVELPVAVDSIAAEPVAEPPAAIESIAEEPVAEDSVAVEPVALDEPVVIAPEADVVAEAPAAVGDDVAPEPEALAPDTPGLVAEPPAAIELVAEEPVAEEPAALDEPAVAEESVAEESIAEEPVSEEPIALDEPLAIAPEADVVAEAPAAVGDDVAPEPVPLVPDAPEPVVEAVAAVEPMPAVEAPIAAEPEGEATVAVEPVVEEGATGESVPVVETPVSTEPAVELPVAVDSIAAELVAEPPAAVASIAEEPVALDEPAVAEESVAEESIAEEPVSEEPIALDEPLVIVPEADVAAEAPAAVGDDVAPEPVALVPDAPEPVVEAVAAVEPMPAVEAPIAAEPDVEAAVAVEPVVEEGATGESVPVVETPVSTEPAVELPVAVDSIAAELVAEPPAAVASTAEEPVVGAGPAPGGQTVAGATEREAQGAGPLSSELPRAGDPPRDAGAAAASHQAGESAGAARETKRRRRARRRPGRVEPPVEPARQAQAPPDAAPTTVPASIEAPPMVVLRPTAPSGGTVAASDAARESSGVDAAPPAPADAAVVPFVAPWLRGRLAEAPLEPVDDEDVTRPAIVNFEEEQRHPDGAAREAAPPQALAAPTPPDDWQEPVTATVVPFAPVPPAEERPRARRPEPPPAVAPAEAERPRVNWRRTAAASLLIVLVESAAFGAAYWYVKPPELGYLNVRTSVPGVEVLVDGRRAGQTPASLELAPGRHSIELRGAGVTKVVPVEITAGVQTTQAIQWPKSARVGRLQVKSTPRGARVMIGVELKGTTPVTIENLPVGSHEVVVESDAGSVRSAVKVRADQTTELDVGIYSGWLAVFSPVEVRIFEGGKMIGTTLDGRLMMRPGTHTIELRNPSLGLNETRTVEITPGRVTALSLQAPTGTLTVDAPAGTEVVVDGDAKGAAPLPSISVAVGTREVVLRHPQLGQRRFVVTVGAKAPVLVSFMAPQ